MVAFSLSSEEAQPAITLFDPFPTTPRIQENNLYALIEDFFDWLETDWQLPTSTSEIERVPLPLPVALSDGFYTAQGLARLYGYTCDHVYLMLKKYSISPSRYTPHMGRKGRSAIFKKQQLAPLIARWEWKRLLQTLDHWWLRFFPPACGICQSCQSFERFPKTQQMNCSVSIPINQLRSVFAHFLEELSRLGSISAWWSDHYTCVWNRETRSAWGIMLIYLLDRRLLHLSSAELLQLEPICNKSHQDHTRLWRNRRPQEYAQFQQAMEAANYRSAEKRNQALTVLSLLILLKYGLSGIAELGRPLSPGEIQQVCSERRLVTLHLGGGIYLPYPLTSDIRVGHVVLDDIRHYFWQYAASQEQEPRSKHWRTGPRNWEPWTMSIVEQALAAPMYEQAVGILSRRPETERQLYSPWHIANKGKLAGGGFALLPNAVQEHLLTYITYVHQEQGIEETSLRGQVSALMFFFNWALKQGKLAGYPYWTRERAQEIFRNYAFIGNADVGVSTRHKRLNELAHFFSTLAELEYPVPAGYHLLYKLETDNTWQPRVVPREEIMDRVFLEGVCNLNYDPFARLALTIQYYCGTRISETIDLHLLCVLEDAQGHAYLLIPRGKSKQERPFPIVQLGMGYLFTYMEEIINSRISHDRKTSLTLGKTNMRYLADEPERAMDWHYLFDRVPGPDGPVKSRGRLSTGRVRIALQEARLIAARINPEGLFQPGTYHSDCQCQRKKGQYCHYFAAQEGITTCPCCGSHLSGQRGARCRHILDEDFKCDGAAQDGELFCPKCDAPLAALLPIVPHTFRHNSVSRAHRAGVSLAQNMKLHGHQTIPMHLRYLHLFLEDAVDEVQRVFAEKRLREVLRVLGTTSGQIVEGGIAHTVSLERYLGITLQRVLKRRTFGVWGGFWAGALAQRGVASPNPTENDIVILEDTYEHAAAQYWYEALGLAVSEVAFERVTKGKWRAEVPRFLDRQKIEDLVQFYLRAIQDSLETTLGMKLMETDIREQRQFLDKLAEMLHPWWKHQGSIDALIEMFAPGGGDAFTKLLPPTESES